MFLFGFTILHNLLFTHCIWHGYTKRLNCWIWQLWNGNELTLIRTKPKLILSNSNDGNRMQNTGSDLDLWVYRVCSLLEWKVRMAKEINQSLSQHIVSWNIMQIKDRTGERKKREIDRMKWKKTERMFHSMALKAVDWWKYIAIWTSQTIRWIWFQCFYQCSLRFWNGVRIRMKHEKEKKHASYELMGKEII